MTASGQLAVARAITDTEAAAWAVSKGGQMKRRILLLAFALIGSGGAAMATPDLVDAIMVATGLKVDSGKQRVRAYHKEGIIVKNIDGSADGTYQLVPSPSVKV